jgi:hypothetical protein
MEYEPPACSVSAIDEQAEEDSVTNDYWPRADDVAQRVSLLTVTHGNLIYRETVIHRVPRRNPAAIDDAPRDRA